MKSVILKVVKLLLLFKKKCESKRILTTFIFLLLIFFPELSNCQKQNNIWCFGDSSGIDFNDSLNPIPISTSVRTRGSCVSYADSSGQLLFYANTRAGMPGNSTRIWNSLNQLMENGDSIVGRGWYNDLIIIPNPASATQFYLFVIDPTSFYGLYYSLIDMQENSGLGKVVLKNIQIHPYQGWDGIAAVKHANGRDWWLITKDDRNGDPLGDNIFTIYFISPSGIAESRQGIGNRVWGNACHMQFSKSGSRLLFSTNAGLIEFFDFDRCTGIFSNAIVISGIRGGGSAITLSSTFSANENVIYVSQNDTTSYLFQYDLTASNIAASKDTLQVINSPVYYAGLLRLAPDDKIYWSGLWNNGVNYTYPYADTMYNQFNMNLSVINDPNVLGSGCNLTMNSFYLNGKRTYWGLPNNPDYSMGSVAGSICASLTNSVLENLDFNFEIYPNPTTDKFYIKLSEEAQGDFKMFDHLGRNVMSGNLSRNSELDLVNFKPGIYYFELHILNKIFRRKIVKVDK